MTEHKDTVFGVEERGRCHAPAEPAGVEAAERNRDWAACDRTLAEREGSRSAGMAQVVATVAETAQSAGAVRACVPAIIVCAIGFLALLLGWTGTGRGAQENDAKKPEGVPTEPELKKAEAVLRGYLAKRLEAAEAMYREQTARAEELRRRIAQASDTDRQIEDAELRARLATRMGAAQVTIREQTARAEDLHRRIGQERELAQDLRDALAEAEAAEMRSKSAEAKKITELAAQIAQAHAARSAAEADVEKTHAELARAQEELQNAEATVIVPSIPGEGGVHPVFIECHAAGISIARLKGSGKEETDVSLGSIQDSQALASIAKEVAADSRNGGNQVVNFLVRPGGVNAYDKALRVVRNSGAPFASVPLTSDDGKLRIGP